MDDDAADVDDAGYDCVGGYAGDAGGTHDGEDEDDEGDGDVPAIVKR